MNIMKNEGEFDRLGRIIFSEVLFIIAFFWLSGPLQITLYIVSLVFLVTGVIGFCGLYALFSINTSRKIETISKISWVVFILFFILIGIIGSYSSIFFTKKTFLEDYNRMNNYYKQALFNTGKEQRSESISNYDLLVSEYKAFLAKYTEYHPYSLKGDSSLNSDFQKVASIIFSMKEKVYTGDLKETHLDLEKIRPILQDILKRNNFSLLAISLVDFHDVMENVIEAADARNVQGVLESYTEADKKLKVIEEVLNDAEIQTIRKNLDDVRVLAEQKQVEMIGAKAVELKSSFVKVYLKRG